MSQIATRVRALRLARGETQEDVARRAGMPTSTYQRLELGYHVPSIRTLRKVATAFDVKPSELIDDDVA
jgi:transcriptional regulator with XRE-family HTH domain